MASIIISDELEISKMDTEAVYAAINGLTLGHEELLGAGFVCRVAPHEKKMNLEGLIDKILNNKTELLNETCISTASAHAIIDTSNSVEI
ncbi:hypothetical protein CAEBREN_15015 [Caenorhabditis brenneri]|uniref:Uncharacterized protein n=1 Tax=Caenorhabditis brenneri TaxID=135651 RepID=G0P0M2_CAEBE|nr:hypothetical protein CAEBREN_15015 [Caenorhabditis brenneri]